MLLFDVQLQFCIYILGNGKAKLDVFWFERNIGMR